MAKLTLGQVPEAEDTSLDKHRKAFQLDHPDGSVMARHLEPKVRDFVNQGIGKSEAPTVTPNTPTILACVPNYNQIYILWDVQLGLINLDHYDIQVSTDDATWYSVVAGAKTGVLNAVTSVDNPNFSHTSIPFSGTSASPTGSQLYYRVRRVTQEAVEGSWSASANATTVPLATGDISASAVTEEKLNNGAVTENKIGSSAVTDIKVATGSIAGRHISYTGNVYGSDDPLPVGDELFDLSQPDCESQLVTRPLPGFRVVHEPKYIGSVLNPRVKTNFHGAIGVWKATTNLLSALHPSDWSTATGGKTASNATAVNEYVSAIGRTATKFTLTAANGGVYITVPVSASTQYTFSIGIYAEGTPGTLRLHLSDLVDSGSYTDVELVDGINYISVTHTTDATTPFYCYIQLLEASGSLYVLDGQLELGAYATPFTPSTRPVGSLSFNWAITNTGTIEFWYCPLHPYDTSVYHTPLVVGTNDGSAVMIIYYDQAQDKIKFSFYRSAGNETYGTSSQFTSNAQLNVYHHIKLVWNISGNSFAAYLNGTAISMTVTGTIAGASPASILRIGYDSNTIGREADALFCDLRISSTADTSTAHYTTGRPYYDPYEIANASRSIRQGLYSDRRFGNTMTFRDYYGRMGRIGATDGLYMEDATGKTIHDIPNGVILSGMAYGGHILFVDAPDYIDQYSSSYTGTSAIAFPTSGTRTVDLSSYLPTGLTNINGALLYCYNVVSIDGAKVGASTLGAFSAKYSTSYNTTPGVHNYMSEGAFAAVTAGAKIIIYSSGQVVVPVAFSGGVPYITWDNDLDAIFMATASGTIKIGTDLFLLGFLI